MLPVIAVPYGARIFRVPPSGVNTEGLVELVTTPRGSRASDASWSYPDFETLCESDTGIRMTGWKSGASTIGIDFRGPVTSSSAPRVVGDTTRQPVLVDAVDLPLIVICPCVVRWVVAP